MKTIPKRFALVAAGALLAACSTVTVTTDYDRSAPFAKYTSYALAPAAYGQTLSPSAEAALRDSLRAQLAARGIRETAPAKADLDVVRHVFLRERLAVQQYTDWGYGYHGTWPYGFGHYGMWAGAPRTYTDVTQYTEGTLVLDFVDARTKKLVFRGVGKAVVGGPESNARKIQEAVAKMVAQLPAGATR
jgi:Domain of unknown function (DUF4136)